MASVSTSDVPSGGYKVIENWAAELFAKQGGVARRDGFGEVLLDYRAAVTSMAHSGANLYKKAAFAAVKDVVERGALVLEKSDAQEDSFYFSAPVDIDGRTNIETVLVHRDPNTQRMYLHSVATKENLLNQRVSSADAEASGRSGSTDSGEVRSVIQSLLTFKASGVSKVVDVDGKPLVVFPALRPPTPRRKPHSPPVHRLACQCTAWPASAPPGLPDATNSERPLTNPGRTHRQPSRNPWVFKRLAFPT